MAQQEKDKLPVSTTSIEDHMSNITLCDPAPPEQAKTDNFKHLTQNQLFLIARLVWYQDGFDQPSEADIKTIKQMWQSEEEEEEGDLPFRQITGMTILTVQLIVEFAKGLPAFAKISQTDQITLIKACSSEVVMLRVSRRYDPASDSVVFANKKAFTRENYSKVGMANVLEDLLHFCRNMHTLSIDNVQYAFLTAIIIFSDRPDLDEPRFIEDIQKYYLNTLRCYIWNLYSGSSRCAVVYGKLLAVLTEIRTIGNQNAHMYITLKMKNRKLPPLLEEIWNDTEDIPLPPNMLDPEIKPD